MHHRRPKAVAAPVLGLLLAASLSACGFHSPTDRVNTISAGENNRTGSVNALGIRILTSSPGQGRLIGALANNSTTSAATVTKVAVAGGGVSVAKFTPIQLQDGASYNLGTQTGNPITFSGNIEPGQVLMGLQITFTTGGQSDTISMNVPVVKNCHQYTAVPTPTPSSSAAPSKGLGKGAASHAAATATASATATSASPTADTNAYDCTDPSPSGAPVG